MMISRIKKKKYNQIKIDTEQIRWLLKAYT